MLQIVLRFAHVFFGAMWVGMMAFQIFFLGPALADVGADAGKLMAAMVKRKIPVFIPIFALITLVSGFWLFARMSGGNAGALMRTPMGMGFGLGGVVALLAFVIGVVVMRPAMMRSMQLAESRDPAAQAEIQRLRARATVTGNVVTVMLFFTLTAMAVARYL
ncbi:MAG TPA: hypothetical protein VMR92_03920 [Gemmatimonadales bacterium]|jgi:uncharacterized membrane protein|nr:hypothetical protein [Gemmatimonadales bacterium]